MKRTLADNIRAAAQRAGMNIEQFRLEHGLANGTFYDLLGGKPVRTMRVLAQLRKAGVSIPRNGLQD